MTYETEKARQKPDEAGQPDGAGVMQNPFRTDEDAGTNNDANNNVRT